MTVVRPITCSACRYQEEEDENKTSGKQFTTDPKREGCKGYKPRSVKVQDSIRYMDSDGNTVVTHQFNCKCKSFCMILFIIIVILSVLYDSKLPEELLWFKFLVLLNAVLINEFYWYQVIWIQKIKLIMDVMID